MNGLGKPFRKNPIQKIEKTVKMQVKLPHVNKKPIARKRSFVQTPFSLYFKFRAKFHAAKPLAFSLQHSRTSPDVQFQDFSLTTQKN